MIYDLQKASMWKRIAAWLFDAILVVCLSVGCCYLLSAILGYDGYSQSLDAAYAKYETQYGITFDISQEAYEAMSQEQRQNYDDAYEALTSDAEAIRALNITVNLTLVITTIGILLAMILLDFVVPLFFGNGQTLGKKAFGLGLMRVDGVRMNNLQLFTRTVLGKFAVETMIPVYVVLMLFFGAANQIGLLLLLALLISQCVIVLVTHNNSLLHDLMAGTVVVDISSQMIFPSEQAMIDYKNKIQAERAAQQDY